MHLYRTSYIHVIVYDESISKNETDFQKDFHFWEDFWIKQCFASSRIVSLIIVIFHNFLNFQINENKK